MAHLAMGVTLVVLVVVFAVMCFAVTNAQLVSAPMRCTSSEAYYVPDGRDYRGFVNVTTTGILCQRWTLQVPHPHDIVAPNPLLGLGDDNFCRNPFGDSTVGCYTMAPDVVYAPCSIGPPCTLTPVTRAAVVTPSDGATVDGGIFVSAVCWPGPCDIYYTIDGSTPDQRSPLYQRPWWVSSSVTVTIAAYFLDGSRLYNASRITVRQLAPPVAIFPPAGTYAGPVLVSLACVNNATLSSGTVVALSTGAAPFVYTGPFWISDDVTVTVVQGTTVVASGTFLFRYPAPSVPSVIPSSGTFLGSVKLLIQPMSGSAVDWFVSFNGSWFAAVSSPVLTLSTFGSTTLTVQARFVTGVVSRSTFRYLVLPLSAPSCSPPPGDYSTAINVSCRDPRGNIAPLTLLLSANNAWVSLSAPGSYTLIGAYLDDSVNTINTTLLYRLFPQQLPSPLVSPCGGTYVAPYLVLNVSAAAPGAVSVSTYASNATVLQSSPLSSTTILQSLVANGLVVVASFSVSVDPMLSMSLPTTCTFTFSSGQFLSTTVRALGSVDTAQLASCLLLPRNATALLLSTVSVGPYLLLNLRNVSNETRQLYGQRIAGCLSADTNKPLLEGNFSLVVQLTASVSMVNASAAPVAVSVMGYSVERCFVKAVRVAYSCDDVGIMLPVSQQAQVWFQSAQSGTFRFCAAEIGSGLTAPFYSPTGPILTVAPTVVAAPVVSPCGGPLTAPLTVVIAADAASIDGSAWTQVASTLLTPTGKPRVISASVGDQTVTCVYWAPVALKNLSYSFFNDFAVNASVLVVASTSMDASVVARTAVRVFLTASPSCATASLGGAVFQTGTVGTSTSGTNVTLTLDDPVPWSALQSSLVVCVTDMVTASAVAPTVAPLNWLTAQTFPCTTCSSTFCLRNGSCVCSNIATGQSWVCAPSSPAAGGTPLLTTMRVILLGAYVVLTVVMLIVARSRVTDGKKESR